ncbi:MAG: trypsin-like peptidase domain-containing protein [Litorilinea sp.]
MVEPKARSSRGILWVFGAVVLLLIFGCMLVAVAGVLYFRTSSSVITTTNSSPRVERVQQVPGSIQVAPPPERVVIEPPPEGMDYETAVLMNIYQEVNPSVVNVTVLGRIGQSSSGLFPSPSDEDFPAPDEDFPAPSEEDEFFGFGSGSGFVWDIAGHIVTNNHVIEGAEEVQVTFSDGTAAIAQVVGADVDSDLAVLRIAPNGYTLRPVARGNLDDVAVGMRVAAIGNPFGLEGTLTAGIVSAVGRSIPARSNFSIPDSIQTDAPINPGNSGGPLLNEQGQVIGVNAQIRSEVRANSGIGFAIPIAIVERVVPALIANGEYQHSFIGVSGGTFSPLCADSLDIDPQMRGAIIGQVLDGTPASRAGLQGGSTPSGTRYPSICPIQRGGDLITAIDGTQVSTFDDVLAYLARNTSPGDTITFSVYRGGETVEIDVTLGARPSSVGP